MATLEEKLMREVREKHRDMPEEFYRVAEVIIYWKGGKVSLIL